MVEPLEQLLSRSLGERYQIERELGRGGMAAVFLALDLKHGRRVALKVLHPGLAAMMGTERFTREIAIAANLNHPHIVPVLDSGLAGELPYYAMPYVEGESLRARLEREGTLPFADALALCRDVGSALDASHRSGLIHRDIKPENILLSHGQAVVADFGIARVIQSVDRLTAIGTSLGTPTYMSPEQMVGADDLDGRSDQYSLACVGYEMLTGHAPFSGASFHEVAARHATAPVPPLTAARGDVPGHVEATLNKALAKNPADRFATVGEFIASLAGAPGEWVSGTAAAPPLPARRHFRTAVVAGLVVAAAGTGWFLFRRPSQASGDGRTGPVSIAVLPLVSRGEDSLHFADGLSDELATRLTRVEGISVIARNNTLRSERDTESQWQEIGRRLGVEYVVAGSLQWSVGGAQRRVVVRPMLVRVADGKAIWGATYTNVVADLFAVQADVAQQVVAGLEIRLGSNERRAIVTPPTANREAYSLYSLGRFHWKKRTTEGLQLAATYFDRAIAIDSSFARAYAGLADAYVLFSQFDVRTVSRKEAYARARAAALAALRRDSTLAEAHASLGEVLMYADRDWPGAEAQFQSAIALDPTYATGRQWYTELLAVVGRHEEALAQGERAEQLDPTSVVTVHAHALALRGLHRFTESIPLYRRTLEIDPAFGYGQFGLLLSLIGAGERDSANAQLARMGMGTDLHRAWVAAAIDSTAAPAGRRLVASNRAIVGAAGPAMAAMIYAAVNDQDRAIGALAQIVDDQGAVLPALKFAEFDRLRGDPRFATLVERMGFLPDQRPPK